MIHIKIYYFVHFFLLKKLRCLHSSWKLLCNYFKYYFWNWFQTSYYALFVTTIFFWLFINLSIIKDLDDLLSSNEYCPQITHLYNYELIPDIELIVFTQNREKYQEIFSYFYISLIPFFQFILPFELCFYHFTTLFVLNKF